MGGDGDECDLDKSSEEAFHPDYIPQCFFIDGSNDEQFLCSLSNAGENRTFYFVIILFSY